MHRPALIPLAMNRITWLLMVALLVVSLAGMGGVAVAQDDAADEAAMDAEPGERLTGVINVVGAEIDGEIAERGFGMSVAEAASNDSKAELVAAQQADVEERLDTVEQRQDDLNAALEAGEISEGQYAAEMAKLEAERASAERLANQSAAVAGELPEEVLAEQGINVTAIDELRERANELGGEEVAAIAQEIAGPSVGEQFADQAGDRIPAELDPAEDRDTDRPDEADDTPENGTDI